MQWSSWTFLRSDLSVDFFDDATLAGFDDVGTAVPVDIPILPQSRRIAIDLLRECLDLDAVGHALARPDLGAHGAAGCTALALYRTRLGVLADDITIGVAERRLALFGTRRCRRGRTT